MDLLDQYWIARIRAMSYKEKVELAELLGIGYQTLSGKTRGVSKFTQKQRAALSDRFALETDSSKPTPKPDRSSGEGVDNSRDSGVGTGSEV